MNVLLSIKPQYVKEIIAGRKKYEFRKSIYKTKDVKKIYIYSSSPEQRIVGMFTPAEVIEDSPANLWRKYKNSAGISKEDFFNYFDTKQLGFAIPIDSLEIFSEPINPKEIISKFTPPQSFQYINDIDRWRV